MPKKDEDKANMNVFNAILTKAINTPITKTQKTVDKKKSKKSTKGNNPQ